MPLPGSHPRRGAALVACATLICFASGVGAMAESAAPSAPRGDRNFPVTWSAPARVVVPMKMRHGLPTVPCSLNGHSVWCIVDTGAQECVLEAQTARDCQVRLITSAQARVEVAGACGSETARIGVPTSVAIGAWQWQGFPFVVRASSAAVADSRSPIAFDIVGMSALQTMCSYVTIDYARHEAVFGFRQPYRPSLPAAGRTSFEMRHGVPIVKVSHDGQNWDALLDTGASSKMEIGQATAAALDFKGTPRWFRGSRIGLGKTSAARERKFQSLNLSQVACLGQNWKNVDAILVESETKVGSGLCQSQRLTMDFANSLIWLESPVSHRE